MMDAGSPAELKTTMRDFVRQLSAHTSMEEQALHHLYKSKLGEQGRRFYDESLEYDNRDKKALDLLEKDSTFENRDVSQPHAQNVITYQP